MGKKKRNQKQKQKRSSEHQRRIEELRRSNAAGSHGSNKYSRREKYRPDYRSDNVQY